MSSLCRVDPVPHDAPKPPGYTRFVCVSDTHSRTDPIQMPYGDVLIHAGDFTELGLPSEVKKFNEWLGRSQVPAACLVLRGVWHLMLPSLRVSHPCSAQCLSAGLGRLPWPLRLCHVPPSCPARDLPLPTWILTVTSHLFVEASFDPPKGTWLRFVWSTCVFRYLTERCSLGRAVDWELRRAGSSAVDLSSCHRSQP